jgi:ankyrin repeat protein
VEEFTFFHGCDKTDEIFCSYDIEETKDTLLAKSLIKNNMVNVNEVYEIPLAYWALQDVSLFETLMKNEDLDVNQHFGEYTLLIHLVCSDSPTKEKCLDLLLTRPDLDLEIKDTEYGRTALEWAIKFKHESARTALEKAGAEHPVRNAVFSYL